MYVAVQGVRSASLHRGGAGWLLRDFAVSHPDLWTAAELSAQYASIDEVILLLRRKLVREMLRAGSVPPVSVPASPSPSPAPATIRVARALSPVSLPPGKNDVFMFVDDESPGPIAAVPSGTPFGLFQETARPASPPRVILPKQPQPQPARVASPPPSPRTPTVAEQDADRLLFVDDSEVANFPSGTGRPVGLTNSATVPTPAQGFRTARWHKDRGSGESAFVDYSEGWVPALGAKEGQVQGLPFGGADQGRSQDAKAARRNKAAAWSPHAGTASMSVAMEEEAGTGMGATGLPFMDTVRFDRTHKPKPVKDSIPVSSYESLLRYLDRSERTELERCGLSPALYNEHLPLLLRAIRFRWKKRFTHEEWTATHPDWSPALRCSDVPCTTASPLELGRIEATMLNAPLSQKYHLSGQEGRGGYATVYRAKLKSSELKTVAKQLREEAGAQGDKLALDGLVAVKMVTVSTPREEVTLHKEIAVLELSRHPNILTYFEAYKHKEKIAIVTEFMEGGTLERAVQNNFGIKLSEKLIALIARNILRGLRYLHDLELIHRDLKSANVMLSSMGEVKIIDFGLVCHLSDKTARTHLVGSPYWLPPEMTRGLLQTPAVDIWSAGVTLTELANGPFRNSGLKTIFSTAALGMAQPLDNPNLWTPAFADFLSSCLQLHPADRLTVRELHSLPRSLFV